MRRLEGVSALISGGASGVGRATAHRFAEEGAELADRPHDRLGSPAEIAGTYAYLASADGAYTTGQNILVDGGMTTNVFPVADELQ